MIKRAEYVDGDIDRLRPLLQAILRLCEAAAWMKWNKPLVLTSLWREPLHDGDLHTLYRAVDFDVDEGGHYDGVEPGQAQYLADLINKHVAYDLQRPYLKCAVYGDTDPKGKHWNHVHLQVHDRSRVLSLAANDFSWPHG